MGQGGLNRGWGGGSYQKIHVDGEVIGKQHLIRNLFLGQSAERTIMSSSRKGKMYNALSPLFIPRMRGRPVSVGHPRRGHRSPLLCQFAFLPHVSASYLRFHVEFRTLEQQSLKR